MTGDVMRLNAAVNRLDGTFPAILQGLIDLGELAKGSQGARGRLVELVRHDFNEYIAEVGEITERLHFLNTNLSLLITAARKFLEAKS